MIVQLGIEILRRPMKWTRCQIILEQDVPTARGVVHLVRCRTWFLKRRIAFSLGYAYSIPCRTWERILLSGRLSCVFPRLIS
jgi:hypothetical protein